MCDKQRASGWPGVGPWGPHAPRRECVPFGASVHGGEDENYPYEDAHHIKQEHVNEQENVRISIGKDVR